MSTLTSRNAERFARLIDLDAPPAFLDGGEAPMRPAVTLTAALRSAGHTATPRPLSADARLAMRQRLVAAANLQAAELPTPGITARAKSAGHRVTRRTSALVGSVAIITSFSGVGVAAAHSLPGSPFYDLKRATEKVQLWLASGAAAKGERHLDFARERLDEAQALGADSPYVASSLRAMNQETREATTDLINAYKSSGENEPLATLVTFTREQYAELLQFGNVVGDRLEAQTFYSLTLLTGVAQEVQSISGTTCLKCIVTGEDPHTTPAPGGNGSTSPSPNPTSSSPAASPSTSTSASHPGSKPPNLIPTGIIPTEIPTKLPTLPPLLTGKNGKNHSGVFPTLSPLPLISTLTKLLTGR